MSAISSDGSWRHQNWDHIVTVFCRRNKALQLQPWNWSCSHCALFCECRRWFSGWFKNRAVHEPSIKDWKDFRLKRTLIFCSAILEPFTCTNALRLFSFVNCASIWAQHSFAQELCFILALFNVVYNWRNNKHQLFSSVDLIFQFTCSNIRCCQMGNVMHQSQNALELCSNKTFLGTDSAQTNMFYIWSNVIQWTGIMDQTIDTRHNSLLC